MIVNILNFLYLQVYESTGVQILTDLSFINSCETIIDAVNEPKHEPEYFASSVAFSAGAGPQSKCTVLYWNLV